MRSFKQGTNSNVGRKNNENVARKSTEIMVPQNNENNYGMHKQCNVKEHL